MSAENDGGPAFPCDSYGIKNGRETTIPTNGMSLRDWFAGQALNGLMVSCPHSNVVGWAPKDAYTIADAMLVARLQGGVE